MVSGLLIIHPSLHRIEVHSFDFDRETGKRTLFNQKKIKNSVDFVRRHDDRSET